MKTYRIGSFTLLLLVCVSGLAFRDEAHAVVLKEKSLETHVEKLRSDIETLSKTLEASTAHVGTCPVFWRTLSGGMSGDDVRSLQEYLRSEGYFREEATGYFGRVTRAAVIEWQNAHGISALGVMGPLTRARIKERCDRGEPPVSTEDVFKATPVRGSAPLPVTFSTWISGFRAQNVTHRIDFGDGTSVTPTACLAPADACIAPGADEHTYRKSGTYTATLYRITDPCYGNSLCKAAIQREALGTVTLSVGEMACTREYKPVCGSKSVVCVTTPCNPIQQTYSNSCTMKADGATLLYDGSCRATENNKPPVISSFSGPTTLSVGEKGTWKIQASDPEKGVLTYAITWGDDEITSLDSLRSGVMSMPVRQTSTFTHSYVNPGEYTVRVTVTDDSGNEAETTTTVTIEGEVACPTIFDPVCGRPTGCANTCGSGMYCTMMCQMPEPVTYGNTCVLRASGAEMLHRGECTPGSGLPTY